MFEMFKSFNNRNNVIKGLVLFVRAIKAVRRAWVVGLVGRPVRFSQESGISDGMPPDMGRAVNEP